MTHTALLRHFVSGLGLALLSGAIVWLMIHAKVMDHPDDRKSHDHATPKGGGVGIVVSFLAGIAALYWFAEFARLANVYFLGVIATAVAIAVISFLDDIYDWPFAIKLGTQALAAVIAVSSGLYVNEFRAPWIGTIMLGWFGVAATLFWLLFTTNAMNFIDGLNGLASGVTAIACGFLAWIAITHGGWFVYAAAGLLGAGVLGFLPFNFPRARIFMGDVGSQFCGFMLAVLAIVATRFDGVELSCLLMPLLLNGVLFDVAFTLCRRAWQGESLTQAHRGHLYQVAHRAGVPATTVTLVHWGFAVAGGLCCLVFIAAPTNAKPFVPLLLLIPQAVWIWLVSRWANRVPIGRWG